jgi:hypothetical protein
MSGGGVSQAQPQVRSQAAVIWCLSLRLALVGQCMLPTQQHEPRVSVINSTALPLPLMPANPKFCIYFHTGCHCHVTVQKNIITVLPHHNVCAGPVGATAAAAAIKWIIKDGIGAAGRLLVGGRLGLEFDDDPRRWRMAAEALTTAGAACLWMCGCG